MKLRLVVCALGLVGCIAADDYDSRDSDLARKNRKPATLQAHLGFGIDGGSAAQPDAGMPEQPVDAGSAYMPDAGADPQQDAGSGQQPDATIQEPDASTQLPDAPTQLPDAYVPPTPDADVCDGHDLYIFLDHCDESYASVNDTTSG